MPSRPKVVLFDIGGVCVLSPFRAILDYELSHNIPPGWINASISASGNHGAWQRLERGQVPLDAAFFAAFHADLTNEARWRSFYAAHLARTRRESTAQAAEEAAFTAPPPPAIDAEWLYWQMMRVSRATDPHMYPALKQLRAHADAQWQQQQQQKRNGAGAEPALIVAALSNTSIFPDGHEFRDPTTAEGKVHEELRGQFDLFVSSAHVGMRKPDREIYEYTIGELDRLARERGDEEGVRAGDVVFLDDIGANLKAGKAVGFRTIKVVLEKTDRAVKELEEVMGLDLSGAAKARL